MAERIDVAETREPDEAGLLEDPSFEKLLQFLETADRSISRGTSDPA